MNAGALLFQANVIESGLPVDHEGILEEGKDFVSFSLDNLEERLLEYLENEGIASGMASSAFSRIKEKYSYEELASSLTNEISKVPFKRESSSLDEDDFLLGNFLWQQHQNEDTRLLELHSSVKLCPLYG